VLSGIQQQTVRQSAFQIRPIAPPLAVPSHLMNVSGP